MSEKVKNESFDDFKKLERALNLVGIIIRRQRNYFGIRFSGVDVDGASLDERLSCVEAQLEFLWENLYNNVID